MIDDFAKLIPASARGRSGSVFYSGRAAFSSSSPLYILGLNPGGSATEMAEHTVDRHTARVLSELSHEWSEYVDEQWQGAPAGTWKMQPRVRHMLEQVGLDPRRVPASNVVFGRSSRESSYDGDMGAHAEEAWPFHAAVIQRLRARVILCLGGAAGALVRRKLRADILVDSLVESNNRRWTSQLHRGEEGIYVLTATHPSVADWRNPASDPTPLLRRALVESLNTRQLARAQPAKVEHG